MTHFLLVSSSPLGLQTGQGDETMPLNICWDGRKRRQITLNGQAEADRAPREGGVRFSQRF